MDCYYCKAKEYCIAAAQPGSMVCLVNRPVRSGAFASIAVSRCERSGGNGSATM